MYNLKKVCLVMLILCIAAASSVFAASYEDEQEDVDETIAQLEEENRELEERLASARSEADELIAYHQKHIKELNEELQEYEEEGNVSKVEQTMLETAVNEIYLQILTSFYGPGLSRTTYPDLMITEQLPLWLEELGKSGTLGWNKGGLDQLSALAGIYYIQKHMANNQMMIDMLRSKREYGMSEEEYDRYKLEWKLLSSPKAGIKPYNNYSEGTGLSARGLYAYPIRDLVKIYELAEIPVPGTDAYWEMLSDSLFCLESKGVDIGRIMAYHNSLSLRIRTLEPAVASPGFLESIGVEKAADPEDIADVTAWRATLLKTSYEHFLRLARTCDSQALASGLKKQAAALTAFDEALALSADAAVTEIEATQKLTEDILSEIPLVGDAMSLYAVYTGETLSGEQVSGWQRIIDAVLSVGPIGLDGAMKASPNLERMVGSLHAALDTASAKQLSMLSETLHISEEKLSYLAEFLAGVFG